MCSQDTNIDEWINLDQSGIENIPADIALGIESILKKGAENGSCEVGNMIIMFW